MVIDHIISKMKKRQIVRVLPSASLSESSKLLAKNKIGALPVTNENGTILGILSERDIIKEISAKGSSGLNSLVEDVMTTAVSCCGRFDTLKSVIERMNEGRFRHMPVTENDIIVEFISISDLVLAHLNEVEYENDALKGSVTGNVRRQSI
ncbi:MAG: CBS domain-containing protein [Paracoccaceae bacterium]|nr:CBS domain-containing protein [Paracoccaceae bacterium]